GIASTRLGFSHDGITWRHPKGRPAWMGLGEPGDFDAGFMVTANTFTEHGDDLLLYYGAVRYEHGWYINENFTLREDIPLSEQRDMVRIGLARIKRDRFASLTALYDSRFDVYADVRKGEELYVNACCPRGSLRVAITPLGQSAPLPGFSLDDCLPITGDGVRLPVRFKQARVADIPPDRHLKLQFELRTGDLFGYAWGNED
ncbi:MAG: hypothetical protein ACYDCO_25355, partial [Armatimonadota bacterium]